MEQCCSVPSGQVDAALERFNTPVGLLVSRSWHCSPISEQNLQYFFQSCTPAQSSPFPALSGSHFCGNIAECSTPVLENPVPLCGSGRVKGWQGPGPGRMKGGLFLCTNEIFGKALEVVLLSRFRRYMQLSRDNAMMVSNFNISSQCQAIISRLQVEEQTLAYLSCLKGSMWVLDIQFGTPSVSMRMESAEEYILLNVISDNRSLTLPYPTRRVLRTLSLTLCRAYLLTANPTSPRISTFRATPWNLSSTEMFDLSTIQSGIKTSTPSR